MKTGNEAVTRSSCSRDPLLRNQGRAFLLSPLWPEVADGGEVLFTRILGVT